MSNEGKKFDNGKLRFDLLPVLPLREIAKVFTIGAEKYDDRNWEQGISWSRVFGALMRHMWAWWRGEKADPETGYSHLWHAACCIMFLIAYEEREIGEDDRPNPNVVTVKFESGSVNFHQRAKRAIHGPAKCEAYQTSDSMTCARCNTSWDMNDPHPPRCGKLV